MVSAPAVHVDHPSRSESASILAHITLWWWAGQESPSPDKFCRSCVQDFSVRRFTAEVAPAASDALGSGFIRVKVKIKLSVRKH